MSINSLTNAGFTGGKFSSITKALTQPLNDMEMFVWIMAGGGGGGNLKGHSGWGNFYGATGGAGGLVLGDGIIFAKSTDYAVTIGGGGARGSSRSNGGNTTLAYLDGTITCNGGGAGGNGSGNYEGGGTGNTGGSGGGGGTVFANVTQDGNGYNGGQGNQDDVTGIPAGWSTLGNDGGKGNRAGGGASPGRSGGSSSGGTYNVNSYGNGAGTEILKLVTTTAGGGGNSANLGNGGKERGSGGSGMIYIIHSADISPTIGVGLTADEGTFSPNKFLKIKSGSGNISFS